MKQRDPDYLIKAFLEDGLTELPARTYDAVRGEIDHTRQRLVFGPWTVPNLSNYARYALAGAAVLVIAVAGANIWPRLGGFGGPVASPSPTPLPSTSAIQLPPSGDLVAGSYFIDDNTIGPARRLTFSLPDGWTSDRSWRTVDVAIRPDLVSSQPRPSIDLMLAASAVDEVFGDICHWRGTALSAGTSPGELMDALAAQMGRNATAAADAVVGGFPAKRIELTTPDQQAAFCDGGALHYWPAPGRDEALTGLWSGSGNETDVVYAVDVAGNRLVIVARHSVASTPQEIAVLDAIVESIRIEP